LPVRRFESVEKHSRTDQPHIRRWNEERGADPAARPVAGAASLFLLRDDGHAANRQRVNGQTAILVKEFAAL